MIRKIVLSIIFVALLIAIPLALFGVKRIDLGPTFLSFMNRVSSDMNGWKIEIPKIPDIPIYQNANGFLVVLNALIRLVNTITSLINIISTVLNVIIQVLQFICTLIWDLRYLIEDMQKNGDQDYSWAFNPSDYPII